MPMPATFRNTLIWGLLFGSLCFAVGFAFGALRELVLIPALGERIGHLAEFPMVTLAACTVGVWIGIRASAPALAIGLIGVAVLIAFESTIALSFMGVGLTDYLAGYDLTRGALFPIGLALMALSPLAGRKLEHL